MRGRRALGVVLSSLLLAIGCAERELPTSSTSPDEETHISVPAIKQSGGTDIWSDLLVRVDSTQLKLISRPDELSGGVYRFEVVTEPERIAESGEFITGAQGGGFLRRIVDVERAGQTITYSTMEAFWHEVINGGTYEMSTELPRLGATSSPAGSDPVNSIPMPSDTFDIPSLDLCGLAAQVIGQALCGGSERNFTKGGAVDLSGRVDSLAIVGGSVMVTGDMDASFTIDPGGQLIANTGRRPVFSPCDTYPNATGCFARVGAALQSFLASIGINPNVLPPLKMCIPGTPVTVQPGSVFPFRLPVIRICRITDFGALPQFTPPFLGAATIVFHPHITSTLKVAAKGTGTLKLDLPVPNASAVKCFDHGNGFFCLKLGLFISLQFRAIESGGLITITDDDIDLVTLTWTPAQEWTHDIDNESRDVAVDFKPFSTNEFSARIGPAVKFEAELCFGTSASQCDDQSADQGGLQLIDLQVGVGGKVSLGRYAEGVWNRDPTFSNWRINIDSYTEFELEAELTLPRLLIRFDKQLKRSWPFQFFRQDAADLYQTSQFGVITKTTGTSLDPDGYTVNISRADTLPGIVVPGAKRFLPPNWAHPIVQNIASNDSVVFQPPSPCLALYSDAIFVSQSGARRLGLPVPNFVQEVNCGLLHADYHVWVTGVQENCTVAGGLGSKTVRHLADTTKARFDISCTTPTVPPGALTVNVATTGTPDHTSALTVAIDGMDQGAVPINGARTVSSLTPRAGRVVELRGVAQNCVVTNGNPKSVDIVTAATATVNFAVSCGPIAIPSVQPGSLQVTTNTTGANLDPDGFLLSVNGVSRGRINANGTTVINNLPGGTVAVNLSDVASNCTVTNGSVANVSVPPGGTASQSYTITCTSTAVAGAIGNLRVRVETNGEDIDPDGYGVRIGSSETPVSGTDTVTATGLAVGAVSVQLVGLAPNCKVNGQNPRSAIVVENKTAQLGFGVRCQAFGNFDVTTRTTGVELDPDGYRVALDALDQGAIGTNDVRRIGSVVPGKHSTELRGLARNCFVEGAHPRSGEVGSAGSLALLFDVTCIATRDLAAIVVSVTLPQNQAAIPVTVFVDGVAKGDVDEHGTRRVESIRPGDRVITLTGLPEKCRWSSHPQLVNLPAGKTVQVAFTLECKP